MWDSESMGFGLTLKAKKEIGSGIKRFGCIILDCRLNIYGSNFMVKGRELDYRV